MTPLNEHLRHYWSFVMGLNWLPMTTKHIQCVPYTLPPPLGFWQMKLFSTSHSRSFQKVLPVSAIPLEGVWKVDLSSTQSWSLSPSSLGCAWKKPASGHPGNQSATKTDQSTDGPPARSLRKIAGCARTGNAGDVLPATAV